MKKYGLASISPGNYLGLFRGFSEEEISGDGYSRAKWNADDVVIAGKVTTNAEKIEFPQATGDWGEIIRFGLWNSFGDLLFKGPLICRRYIRSYSILFFAPYSIKITFL